MFTLLLQYEPQHKKLVEISGSGQPESAEPEESAELGVNKTFLGVKKGFSNLKKVKNILVYCGKFTRIKQNKRRIREEQIPDVTLNEELLKQSITKLKDKIKKILVSKNLYEDNINILNSGREQFNNWKENITKKMFFTVQEDQ
ncbi:hypothetical protein H8356DRAFT_1437044 [Neocallimastix lanati (nom. inval.)]|nr:hypothetical protein H8356DRAFT_1437044 [Neocallimastix sp. JGI-2020a]